jgi:hypothetical protein
LDDQRVREVDADRMDAHAHLVRAGRRLVDVVQNQGFRAAGRLAEQSFHGVYPIEGLAMVVPPSTTRVWPVT